MQRPFAMNPEIGERSRMSNAAPKATIPALSVSLDHWSSELVGIKWAASAIHKATVATISNDPSRKNRRPIRRDLPASNCCPD
jgi:hypothetical protein